MLDSNDEKYIILVEDREEHCFWYHGEFRALEKEYNIKILVTDAATYVEVCDLLKLVKSGEKKFDCAVVDMKIPREGQEPDNVDWGIQALKEIEKILELDKILIVTAHKDQTMPFLTEAEKRRVRTKNIHVEMLRNEIAKMLNLIEAT